MKSFLTLPASAVWFGTIETRVNGTSQSKNQTLTIKVRGVAVEFFVAKAPVKLGSQDPARVLTEKFKRWIIGDFFFLPCIMRKFVLRIIP